MTSCVWVTTAASFNDGLWHQAIGTVGGGTVTLYVDGVLRGSVAGSTMSS